MEISVLTIHTFKNPSTAENHSNSNLPVELKCDLIKFMNIFELEILSFASVTKAVAIYFKCIEMI